MSIKEHIQNNGTFYILLLLFNGAAFGFGAFYTGLKYFNQDIIPAGTFKTLDEINEKYVTRAQYQQQKILLQDYQLKYYKVLAENNSFKSSEPMWAIQMDETGYKEIDEKANIWCTTIQSSDNPVFHNTEIYEFDGYYYIFKYDKNKSKNQLQEDVKFIGLKYPELKCEIVDLRKYCPSRVFVEAEDFTCGGDRYICKTCK